MTYVIRLTADQFAQVIEDCEVIEADGLSVGPIQERARRIRETLGQEHESPMQQVAERAEAMGDADDV